MKPVAMSPMWGSSPWLHASISSPATTRMPTTLITSTRRNELDDDRTVSSAAADSSAAMTLQTARSRAREKRAGSVTLRANHRPAAAAIPGNRNVAVSFHRIQPSHRCCSPSPSAASCPAASAATYDAEQRKVAIPVGQGVGEGANRDQRRQAEVGAEQELRVLALGHQGGRLVQPHRPGEVDACLLHPQPVAHGCAGDGGELEGRIAPRHRPVGYRLAMPRLLLHQIGRRGCGRTAGLHGRRAKRPAAASGGSRRISRQTAARAPVRRGHSCGRGDAGSRAGFHPRPATCSKFRNPVGSTQTRLRPSRVKTCRWPVRAMGAGAATACGPVEGRSS